MEFTKQQHKIWRTLYENQLKNVEQYACKEFLKGFKKLNLSQDKLPSLEFLNKKITHETGWKIKRTNIRYSDTLPWYQHLSKKEFIVTNYLRSWEELEYTPEPDMFHDIFGHLPFLILPEYVEIFDLFSDAYFRANEKEKEDIKKLAWFSYEFGLIKERGELKIFGAGILSSKGETKHIMSSNTPLIPFTIENVIQKNKAIDFYNEQLFVFESITALKEELNRFFNSLKKKKKTSINQIMDSEMKF